MPGLLAPLPVQHRISEVRQTLTERMKQASSLAHPSLSVGCFVPLCSYREMLGTMRNTRETFKASDRLRFQVNQVASLLQKKIIPRQELTLSCSPPHMA